MHENSTSCRTSKKRQPTWKLKIPSSSNLDAVAVAECCLEERERENLLAHHRPRCLDEEAHAFVKCCLAQCLAPLPANADWFTDTDFEELAAEAQYYEFEVGERVTWQYAHVHALLVIEYGRLELTSNHVHIGTVKRSQIVGTVMDSFYPPPHLRAFSLAATEDSGVFGVAMSTFHQVVVRAMKRNRASQQKQILEFFNNNKHFEGFSQDEKAMLAQASFTRSFGTGFDSVEEQELRGLKAKRPWGVGSLIYFSGAAMSISWSIPFVMEGGVSVNQACGFGPGDCLDTVVSLSGREFLQRNQVPLKLESQAKIIWINFEELDTKFVCELSDRFEHLNRRKPQLVDLKPISHLGEGSFGTVQLVEHKNRGTKYALKRVSKIDGKVPAFVQNECALLNDASHPFVLQLVTMVETEDSVCMVTEVLDGGDLFDLMTEVRRTFRRSFTHEEAQFYVGSVIMGLEALHSRNVVHRDLKPDNVMIDAVGYVRLIDLGISKKLDNLGRTFTIIGTYHYMAPEMFTSRRPGYGLCVDYWALGVLFHELVIGCLPFGLNSRMTDALEIFKAIRKGTKCPLALPSEYMDANGRHLLVALFQKDPDQRLGSSENGICDIKAHPFFEFNGSQSKFFNKLSDWAIEPPFKKDKLKEFAESPKTQAPPPEDQLCPIDQETPMGTGSSQA